MKPYTYDLNKYSIYFSTGFVPVQAWHTGENRGVDGDEQFQLDVIDTTGKPFSQAFEPGFRWLAKKAHSILPVGALVPRIDVDAGDFRARGIPRSDSTIFLIMILGFTALYIGARQLCIVNNSGRNPITNLVFAAGPAILGSVFFFIGSQNSLRQFLGLATVVLVIAVFSSRRYVLCLAFLILSGLFHKWAPVFGFIGILIAAMQRVGSKGSPIRSVEFYHISLPEISSFILGILTVASIKGVAASGLFHIDVPLINDLKPYLIDAAEYQSLERLNSFFKLGAISIVIVGSEVLLGKTVSSKGIDIRSLRRQLFLFILPLVIFPEVFSRVSSLYWAIEAVFLVWTLSSPQFRLRLAGASVFIIYGFAPNAINILIGPGWLHSF
jgi:hypothetical protein